MPTRYRRLAVLATAAAVVVSLVAWPLVAQASGAQRGSRTIEVECDDGDSIQAAIDRVRVWRPVVVEIEGVCVEDLEFSRDNVTLRGVDEDSEVVGEIFTFDSYHFRIDALKVTGGVVIEDGGSAIITNLYLEGPLSCEGGCSARIEGSELTGSWEAGAYVAGNAALTLLDSTVSGAHDSGVYLDGGAFANIERSIITGNAGNGIDVLLHSTLWVNEVTISSNGGDGIYLEQDAAVRVQESVTFTDNGVDTVVCDDEESSVVFDEGEIPDTCTGF